MRSKCLGGNGILKNLPLEEKGKLSPELSKICIPEGARGCSPCPQSRVRQDRVEGRHGPPSRVRSAAPGTLCAGHGASLRHGHPANRGASLPFQRGLLLSPTEDSHGQWTVGARVGGLTGGGRVPREPLPEVSRGDPEGGLGGGGGPVVVPTAKGCQVLEIPRENSRGCCPRSLSRVLTGASCAPTPTPIPRNIQAVQGSCSQCVCRPRNTVPLRPPPGPAYPPAQAAGKDPWSQRPRGAAGIGPPSLPGAAGGGVCVRRGESGTTGKPRQQALPRRLPRHKKPDSSRGPDPFQIYIPLPAARHSGPGLGLGGFLTGWPAPSASPQSGGGQWCPNFSCCPQVTNPRALVLWVLGIRAPVSACTLAH